jgi:hypothetical protein
MASLDIDRYNAKAQGATALADAVLAVGALLAGHWQAITGPDVNGHRDHEHR